MPDLENQNQKVETTTERVDVSQGRGDFKKDGELLKKGDPREIEVDERALEKIEKELDGDEKIDPKMEELKAWRKEWKAEGVISNEELENAKSLLSVRPDKVFEILEKKVRARKLQTAVEKYGREGLVWNYREKAWGLNKTHVVSDSAQDIEFGGGEMSQKTEKAVPVKREKEQNLAVISDEFTELQFTSSGKEEFVKAMEKLAGEHAKEAYAQNLSLIKSEINAFVYGANGKISKEQLINWCVQFNQKLKSLGIKSDIIDIDKIQKLKNKKVIHG